MALEKVSVVDQVEITEHRVVQVRTATRIVEDGNTLAQQLHRHTIAPGQDYSGESEMVKAICAAIHTASAVQAYRQMLANAGQRNDAPAPPPPPAPVAPSNPVVDAALASGDRSIFLA